MRSEWLRLALIAPFVVLCYLFEWTWLRTLTTHSFVVALDFFGVSVVRLSQDTLMHRGQLYRFVVSCTAVDAFFGSIPLLWMIEKSLLRNLLFFGVYFLCLSVVNVARIAVGFVAFDRGVSWWLSHEVVAGIFYFALFLWIARRRGWSFASPTRGPVAASA